MARVVGLCCGIGWTQEVRGDLKKAPGILGIAARPLQRGEGGGGDDRRARAVSGWASESGRTGRVRARCRAGPGERALALALAAGRGVAR